MIWNYTKQILERLSMRAIAQRLDKRRLQHEIDIHRLYLLTSYYRKCVPGSIDPGQLAAELAAASQKLQYEEMCSEVQDNLLQQIRQISVCLHEALLTERDSGATSSEQLAEQRRHSKTAASTSDSSTAAWPRGLAAAVGSTDSQSTEALPLQDGRATKQEFPAQGERATEAVRNLPPADGQSRLSMDQISMLLQEKLGFSLELRPSAQAQGESGVGLWLQGAAQVGSVVALYPGLVYTPAVYRQIPGYPRIDQGNDFLMSRFDGAVLDAKPWGRGGGRPIPEETDEADTPAELWHSQLELRHPLALAHYANHPSKGSQPNVMVAAYEFALRSGDDSSMRRYIPNVMVRKHSSDPEVADPGETVAGLAFVATRDLEDEELLLNYRLSTYVSRPAWYHSVDEEEERRRWA